MSSQFMPLRVSITDKSGTLTTGGTAQTAAAARNQRAFLLIQNPENETENLFFSVDTTAVADSPSISLAPGDGVIFDQVVPTGAVSVIAATTGHQFTVKEA